MIPAINKPNGPTVCSLSIMAKALIISMIKKNVHAFVRGEATYFSKYDCPTLDNVGYNPYKYDSFIKLIDKTPVRKAKRAYLMMKPTLIEPVYRPYIYAEGAEPC